MRYALYVELRQHQVEAHPDVFSHVEWDDSEHLCTPPSTEDVQSSRPVAPFVESPQISQPATLDMVTTRCDWDGCVLRFRDPHELLQHLVKDHVPSATETAQKRFECAWGGCPTTTKTRGHLQGHVSVHVPTTFKPHICELCSKNCRNAGTLTGHMTNVHGFNENSLKPKTKTKTKKKKAPVHVDAKIVKEPAEDARLDVPMVRQPRVATDSKVAAPPLASFSRPTGQAHGGVSAGALGGMAGRISKRKSGDRDEHGKTGREEPAIKRLKFAYNDRFIRKEKKDGRS
ncbi:hypothetical protein EXIGLDRAFT_700253 [Exidia glandulosa HHB12029]|uniref:C2H2-type domain-containing protein n=1 Tax=Exidia glandulosa HHB12029 TaxID=1314781 RepID=A0A165DIF9_EXIGL|nr:hypothetical protein EXIGLDRAFT_700253 [Exidia glandulosa HHB12029]